MVFLVWSKHLQWLAEIETWRQKSAKYRDRNGLPTLSAEIELLGSEGQWLAAAKLVLASKTCGPLQIQILMLSLWWYLVKAKYYADPLFLLCSKIIWSDTAWLELNFRDQCTYSTCITICWPTICVCSTSISTLEFQTSIIGRLITCTSPSFTVNQMQTIIY